MILPRAERNAKKKCKDLFSVKVPNLGHINQSQNLVFVDSFGISGIYISVLETENSFVSI